MCCETMEIPNFRLLEMEFSYTCSIPNLQDKLLAVTLLLSHEVLSTFICNKEEKRAGKTL